MRFLDEDDDDPITAVVNLIDLFVVIIAVLLVVLVQNPLNPFAANSINPGAQVKRGAIYKGRWGDFDLWVYNDWYVDANGVEQPMLPSGTVIMSGTDLEGTRAFGMIYDDNFAYQSLPYAPKSWVENDPAQRMMLMQSSPIVIPSRVNASFAATVL
ncbi:MAG: major capsid protein [Betaproteobacteria bacterium]|nr:major capsid protein [Betaproteobacteria bacterium]